MGINSRFLRFEASHFETYGARRQRGTGRDDELGPGQQIFKLQFGAETVEWFGS
jgi:hypothetical protein